MSILKVELDKPYQISLKWPTGTQKEGRYGPQVQYTLSDGRIMYVPPLAAAQIQSLHIGADEPFILKKYISQAGATHWDVERVRQPNTNGLAYTQPGKTDSVSEPRETPAPRPMQTARQIAAPVAGEPSLTTNESKRIFRQLVATIEAAKAAEDFAKSIDWPVTFTSEDIRAMAISGFIEQSRRAAA